MNGSEKAARRSVGDASHAVTLIDNLREARGQVAAMSEILGILANSSGSPEEVFSAIVQRACTLCRADAAQIHLINEDAYRLATSEGASPEYVELSSREANPCDRASLIGRVSLDRTTQQITDVLADPDYDRPEFQRLGGYRTIMGAPMVVDDEVMGVLTVWRTIVAPFDDRAASLLTTFAAQGALALRNVELFHDLEARSAEATRRVDQLEALSEVGEAVSSSLDADEVLRTIVTVAVELTGTDGGSLMEYDEESQLFSVRTAFGTSPTVLDALRGSRIHIDETLVGRACLSRTPLQMADLELEELDPHLSVLYAAGWRSVVAVPMVRSDRVVGALVVRRMSPGAFTEETCDLIAAFANQSAIALTNARLYQQLELQSAELAQASQHKSEFLASMSHELRTPLNAVIGFSEVLLERMFGDLNDRQEDYLRDILTSGRHLLELLNDVLDLSKVEAGQMELDPSDFSVTDALSYAVSMVRERALDHRVALSLEVDDDVGLVRADELRFKQIMLNLLSNAVKFTPDGGRVQIRAEAAHGNLDVTVSDTGVGIAPADQQRIFDSFQQGGRSARKVEGTGLGLTLTKRIVELHGGRLWVKSELGHGSTFGFSIPLDGDSTTSAPLEPTDTTGDHRPVVVVVEDDHSSAELMSVHLKAAGLRPVTVGNGADGLQAVRDLKPAAVILDIRLPGMDGWDVLGAIKSDPRTASTPVVVVSVIHERGRGFALGASDYLVKPVARDDLLAALRRLVPLPIESSGRRVAVFVDDDPTALELVRLSLEPAGWTVHTCTEVGEALALIRTHGPAVVLVDLLMPDTDGFEVVDMLRSDPRTASLPVVVLTAKTLTGRDRELLDGRIDFVMSKSAVELGLLAERLAQITSAPVRARGEEAG
jgi:signal transduction histidine kinase/DNA-binding response OmpR family regulator